MNEDVNKNEENLEGNLEENLEGDALAELLSGSSDDDLDLDALAEMSNFEDFETTEASEVNYEEYEEYEEFAEEADAEGVETFEEYEEVAEFAEESEEAEAEGVETFEEYEEVAEFAEESEESEVDDVETFEEYEEVAEFAEEAEGEGLESLDNLEGLEELETLADGLDEFTASESEDSLPNFESEEDDSAFDIPVGNDNSGDSDDNIDSDGLDLANLDDLDSLFGDSDDDMFASLMGMGGGSEEDEFAALEALNSGGMSMGGSGDMDLDKQLEMLMAADKSATNDFDVDSLMGGRPRQSVHDPSVDGMGMVYYSKPTSDSYLQFEEKPRLFENISFAKIFLTLVVGVLFIGVGTFAAITIGTAVSDHRSTVAQFTHFYPIAFPPSGVANNVHAVFPRDSGYVGNQSFSISRISLGPSGTFVHFDEYFDPDDYIIFMHDQRRHLYVRSQFGFTSDPVTGTVIRFNALEPETLFLTLSIYCRFTDEFLNFYYRFTEPPHSPPTVFVNNIVAPDGGSTEGLVVRYASFDSGRSMIAYSFPHNPEGVGVRIPEGNEGLNISLQMGLASTVRMTNEPAEVDFSDFGLTLGVANFAPVLDLNGRADVIFHDVVFYYPNPVVTVTPAELFANERDNFFPIQAGPYILNLSQMGQQDNGNLIILTFHGLRDGAVRIETRPSVILRIDLGDGNYLDIPGETRSIAQGGDVVFNVVPHLNTLRNVHIDYYSLIVDSVEFNVDQVRIPLSLSTNHIMPRGSRLAAERTAYEAMVSLLAYKSGDLTQSDLVGMSSELMNNPEILGIFAPTQATTHPMYGAAVASGDLISNYDYIAIIDVQWVAGEGDSLLYFNEVFKVTARSQNAIWTVVDIQLMS